MQRFAAVHNEQIRERERSTLDGELIVTFTAKAPETARKRGQSRSRGGVLGNADLWVFMMQLWAHEHW